MTLDFLKGSAIVGLVVGLWDKIKEFAWKIVSLLIQRVEICTEEAHDSVIAYLAENYKRLPLYDKSYGAMHEAMRNGRFGLVPYEKYGSGTMLFWGKKKLWRLFKPFFIFSDRPDNNPAGGEPHTSYNPSRVYSTITCIRGALDLDEIISQACQLRNNLTWQNDDKEEQERRFNIYYLPDKDSEHHAYVSKHSAGYAWYKQQQYRLLGYKPDDIGRAITVNGKALDNLIFPEEVKSLIYAIELWRKSKSWYNDRGLPWKRGWLLYGPPGTGKTALARAFAEDLDMPIYVYSLSQMSNADLMNAWRNMQINIPCIALIEDVDNIFHGRRNISKNLSPMSSLLAGTHSNAPDGSNEGTVDFTPLTFDCLLNCLDGVDKSDGVFTIITTNDITKIDPALGQPKVSSSGKTEFISTRPGRIDRAIELTYMKPEAKAKMAQKILGEFPEQLVQVIADIENDLQETPAQFQERCAQIAIYEYWKEQEQILVKKKEAVI
jgi:hypothetical protein